ncbi:ras-related protein Rab-44 isoform X2 [Phaenicophaeus curvirostris]|uniref:ras-related protein Rab-44 isoform X2 n=1 Tax=Phaenicophaeus curvirostris TaxID=33595 RepID=UPI0037F0B8AC
MLIPQEEGAGVKKLMLKAAEHPQGAPAESVEAGKLMEMKGVGWRQETTGWEKARLPGDIEEVALSKGENSEAGLGPLEAGLAAGWHLVTGELGPAVAREECAKPQSTGLGGEADPPSGRSEKLTVKPGEHLEPEPPTWGWARMGAAQGDGALPEMTVDPGPRMLEEEHIGAKSLDAIVPAAQHGGSSRAGAEEGEVEVTQPMEAEPQGEFAMGDAARGGTAGTEVLPVPPADGQEGGTGTEVQLREAQSCDVSVRLPAEVGAAPQPPGEPGSPGTEQGRSGAARVEPLEDDDKAELGPGEGPSPAETPAGGADVGGLLPVNAQALELVGTEESWAHMQLREGPSPEAPLGGGDHAALQLGDEGEDGGRRQSERELPPEPLVDLCGAGFRQGGRAGAEEQPRTEADKCSAGTGDAAPLPLVSFWGQKPGLEEDGEVHDPEEEQELELVQGEGANKDGLCLVKAQSLELEEAEEASRVDVQLHGDLSPETPRGEESGAAMQLAEEAEGGGQGQGECEMPYELDPQGEGAGAHVQPQEKAVILESVEDQSTDANTQLLAEAVELKLIPGGSTEEDLQPLSEAGYLGREQRVSTATDVQLQGQMDKPELVELIEAEDFHTGTQLCGGQNPETLQEWGDCAAVHLVEEAEDGGPGQDKRGLPQEHVLHPHGLTIREGEGTPEDVQPWEAVTLESLEDQNTDANTQLLAEVLELKLTPGGSTEEDLQPLSEAGYLGREQGVGMTADVQPLEQVDKPELVELVQAEDLHVETQQGDGAGAGVQPWEEAVLLDTLEDQSSDANMQPLTEVEELKSTFGGRAEADLPILAAAGMQKGEQSQTPSSEAGLCAAYTADALEGAAGAPVSSPGEAASYPACADAPEGPGLDTKLGALPDPDGQILGDTRTLELQQGEGAAAERTPLDEAQGLKVGQGERLEAGVRSFLETQGLGLKQDHGHTASALGPPVSEVALQISMLKLETMMQEDVLVPDVWRLGSSGQAAQNELQEQVSAQADKEEDAGNDQLGMVLGDSSLEDAANSSMQPPRQLLGGESKDLSVGQQKKREAGQQTSQEGKPSPGAVTADGAGAAPGGSPEAFLEPDHLYNVLFVGDSHVGKTSFLYRLHADTFNPHLTATVGLDYQVKNLIVDNKHFALRLWDSAGQERYHSITRQFFRKADGVVLMYDITSEYSFSDVRYWLSCIQEGAEDGVAVLLLGNKTDCAAERRVPTKEGERLAKEHQLLFYECSAASGHNVSESMVSLIRMLKVHEDELKKKAEEVPKPSQKKKGCCW